MPAIRSWIVTACLILGLGSPLGFAQSSRSGPEGSDRVDELMTSYNLHPALQKLGRGVSNFLGGWLEFPLNLQQRYTEADTAGSLFTGAAYGVVKGVVRTGVGLYEVVTFFLPYPEQYAPILPTLEYFRTQGKPKPLLPQ